MSLSDNEQIYLSYYLQSWLPYWQGRKDFFFNLLAPLFILCPLKKVK